MKKLLVLLVLGFGLTISASAQGDQSGGGRAEVKVNKILIGGDVTRGGLSDGGHIGNGIISKEGVRPFSGGSGVGNGFAGRGEGSSNIGGFCEGGTNAGEFTNGNEKGNGLVTVDGSGSGSHG